MVSLATCCVTFTHVFMQNNVILFSVLAGLVSVDIQMDGH